MSITIKAMGSLVRITRPREAGVSGVDGVPAEQTLDLSVEDAVFLAGGAGKQKNTCLAEAIIEARRAGRGALEKRLADLDMEARRIRATLDSNPVG